MRPDYPHKIFPDLRNHFFLLMETLAMLSIVMILANRIIERTRVRRNRSLIEIWSL